MGASSLAGILAGLVPRSHTQGFLVKAGRNAGVIGSGIPAALDACVVEELDQGQL